MTGRAVIDVTADGNQRPVAVGESFQMAEDGILDTRDLFSLLANDRDPEGTNLTLTIVSDPENGLIESFPGGHVRYIPNRDFNGEELIEYAVSDGELSSSSVALRINVTPINDAPLAQADVYGLAIGQDELTVAAAAGVLALSLIHI